MSIYSVYSTRRTRPRMSRRLRSSMENWCDSWCPKRHTVVPWKRTDGLHENWSTWTEFSGYGGYWEHSTIKVLYRVSEMDRSKEDCGEFDKLPSLVGYHHRCIYFILSGWCYSCLLLWHKIPLFLSLLGILFISDGINKRKCKVNGWVISGNERRRKCGGWEVWDKIY